MRFKLIGSAAFASLAVLMIMNTGGAFAAESCSFGNRTSVFGGGCLAAPGRRHDERTVAAHQPGLQPAEVEEEDDAGWDGDREDRRHGYHHRHDRKHRHHAYDGRQRKGHGWLDRDFDLDKVDLESLVRDGFRGGFKIGYAVARKGWEDRIDPDVLESLRNGPLSKTDFARGVEQGYEAGKKGQGRKGHRGARDFDRDKVDLGSLVRDGFRGGFKVGYAVARKGWEDRIDPDVLESLRNGPLSKTDFAKGVEKGYEAGKKGHGRKGHWGRRGHRDHWGNKDRHHAHNGHRGHRHDRDHGHDRGHGKGHHRGDHDRDHDRAHGHDRGHDHGKGHDRGHGRGHGRGHDRGHGKGHDRDHDKGHDRGGHDRGGKGGHGHGKGHDRGHRR